MQGKRLGAQMSSTAGRRVGGAGDWILKSMGEGTARELLGTQQKGPTEERTPSGEQSKEQAGKAPGEPPESAIAPA